MRATARLALASLAVALASACSGPPEEPGHGALGSSHDTVGEPAEVDADPAPRALRLHLIERTTVAVVATRLEGLIDLRASLVIQDDVQGRRSLLMVDQVEALTWTVDGRSVDGGAARLEGATALVTWDARGAASSVEVPETTSAEVARLLRTVALALQTPSAVADGAPIDLPLGRARVHVTGTPERGEAQWTGADYVRVAGARDDGVVRAEGTQRYTRHDGQLVEAHYRERLAVADATHDQLAAELTLDLLPRADGQPPRAERWPRVGLVGAAQVASSAAGRALEGRAARLTFEQLLADLVAQRDSGRMPEHERWLWRASGRLLLEPQHADALGRACVDGTLRGPGRALAIDLLANVGHGPAQAALRRVLSHEDVVAGADYATLLQHAVLIEAPDQATLVFFGERVGTLAGLPRRASLVTLGALVGRTREHDAALAEAHSELLRVSLEAAVDPADQRAALMALSNARDLAAEPRVRERVGARDAGVRAAALRALGSLSGAPESRSLLLEHALTDEEGGARTQALDALARLGATQAELDALAVAVRRGAVPRSDLTVLANFARRCVLSHGSLAPAVGLIEALLAHPLLPRELGHQLARLRATAG